MHLVVPRRELQIVARHESKCPRRLHASARAPEAPPSFSQSATAVELARASRSTTRRETKRRASASFSASARRRRPENAIRRDPIDTAARANASVLVMWWFDCNQSARSTSATATSSRWLLMPVTGTLVVIAHRANARDSPRRSPREMLRARSRSSRAGVRWPRPISASPTHVRSYARSGWSAPSGASSIAARAGTNARRRLLAKLHGCRAVGDGGPRATVQRAHSHPRRDEHALGQRRCFFRNASVRFHASFAAASS